MTGIDFTYVSEIESELDWQTRELLESVCAPIENAVADFDADTAVFLADYGELFDA
jgi:hypothetical protein